MWGGRIALGAVGLFVLLIIVVSATGDESGTSDDSPQERTAPTQFGAEVACEQFVEDRLKAPSTADFSDPVHTKLSDDQFLVEGNVDSENGFGATIRAAWACTVKAVPSGDTYDWQLVEPVKIAQR